MTEADQKLVDKLIESCAERNVIIDDVAATFIILAQKILARDPTNENAQKVLENFATHMRTGREVVSFCGFLLKDPDGDGPDQSEGAAT